MVETLNFLRDGYGAPLCLFKPHSEVFNPSASPTVALYGDSFYRFHWLIRVASPHESKVT